MWEKCNAFQKRLISLLQGQNDILVLMGIMNHFDIRIYHSGMLNSAAVFSSTATFVFFLIILSQKFYLKKGIRKAYHF